MKARHLSFLLALVALAVLAPAAGATVTYEGSFGSPGTGAGEFSSPNGIAIDETTGHVYVSDSTLNRIQEFTADGTFVQMWGQNELSHPQGIAIDDSGG